MSKMGTKQTRALMEGVSLTFGRPLPESNAEAISNIMKEAISDLPVGTQVQITAGSGIDSNKIGTIIPNDQVTVDGRGVPTNIEGAYKPIDWRNEFAIKFPNGKIITMFKNRVHKYGK